MDLTALLHNFAPHLVQAVEQGIRNAAKYQPRPAQHDRDADWRPLPHLSPAQSAELVRAYIDGENVGSLAQRFDVNRCTVHEHLDRAQVARRQVTKLDAADVRRAADLYAQGLSLIAVGAQLGVNGATVATHLKRAGHQLRPRRGCAR